jgi:hypothetical protein
LYSWEHDRLLVKLSDRVSPKSTFGAINIMALTAVKSQKPQSGTLSRKYSFYSLKDGSIIAFTANLEWVRSEGGFGRKDWTGTLAGPSGKAVKIHILRTPEECLKLKLLSAASQLEDVTDEDPLVLVPFKTYYISWSLKGPKEFKLYFTSKDRSTFEVKHSVKKAFDQDMFAWSEWQGSVDIKLTAYQAKQLKQNASQEWELAIADFVLDRWEKRFNSAWTAFFG